MQSLVDGEGEGGEHDLHVVHYFGVKRVFFFLLLCVFLLDLDFITERVKKSEVEGDVLREFLFPDGALDLEFLLGRPVKAFGYFVVWGKGDWIDFLSLGWRRAAHEKHGRRWTST